MQSYAEEESRGWHDSPDSSDHVGVRVVGHRLRTSHQSPVATPPSLNTPASAHLSLSLPLSLQADDSSTDIMMFCPLASYRAQCFFEPILSCAGLALVVHERHQINIHIYIYNMIYMTYNTIIVQQNFSIEFWGKFPCLRRGGSKSLSKYEDVPAVAAQVCRTTQPSPACRFITSQIAWRIHNIYK